MIAAVRTSLSFLAVIGWLFAATWAAVQASLLVIAVVRWAGLPLEVESALLLILPNVALLGTWFGLFFLTLRVVRRYRLIG